MRGRFLSQVADSIAVNGSAITFGVVLVAVWEAMTRSLALPQHIFPPPSFIIWSLYVRADLLMSHAWLTFSRDGAGVRWSVVVGIALWLDR